MLKWRRLASQVERPGNAVLQLGNYERSGAERELGAPERARLQNEPAKASCQELGCAYFQSSWKSERMAAKERSELSSL